jgi:1,4-alpha-glucan branching enzyme
MPHRTTLAGDPFDREALRHADLGDPGAFLGPRLAEIDGTIGLLVRAFHPAAGACELLLADAALPMAVLEPGVFALFLPGEPADLRYRLRFTHESGGSWEREDPYRFAMTLGEFDLYLISQGNHHHLWDALGARPLVLDGIAGWGFTLWAPNARRVSVVGDFCGWDARIFPMKRIGTSGLWDLFLPGLAEGATYKFDVSGRFGVTQMKADPLARFSEKPPGTASRLFRSHHRWRDREWMAGLPARDIRRLPMAIYEVHLGSWLHGGGDSQSYRDLAPKLVEHVKKLGFNFLELLPVAEHPYAGSWGYQVTGYFAPTARWGDPDDFRFFVDYCHRHGIGVLLDWVPAHFVKDAHGLGRFDGTALYEHEDPRRGEHPDWGTYIFNYGRFEVKNFLIANALYLLDEFHIDGLRVDAVASMLHLDYSRPAGQWLPNAQGGRENFEAIAFVRELNRLVKTHYPGRIVIAEESTTFPGVTQSVEAGGLGFTFKWNLGWMHDSLKYFSTDPLFRSGCHDALTFAMLYEYSEAFLNPLSHDEVVHGKGSLWRKMAGDDWQKLANLRAMLTYQYCRPGKKLLFMGSELASAREWNHESGLDWYLLDQAPRAVYRDFLAALGKIYLHSPALWRLDHELEGFRWISCEDRGRSVYSFVRFDDGAPVKLRNKKKPATADQLAATGRDFLLVVMNLTPVPRDRYRVGVPRSGNYRVVLCSDDKKWGGSGYPHADKVVAQAAVHDGCEHSIVINLPPLAVLILEPVAPVAPAGKKAKA